MSVLDMLLWPFWNKEQRRIRTLWRLIAFALLLVFFNFLLGLLLSWGRPWQGSLVLVQTLSAVATLLSLWVAARVLDRRPFVAYGFHLGPLWWRDFAFGFLLGAGLMAIVFLVEWLVGWIHIQGAWASPQGMPFPLAILLALWLFITVAVNEEGISRGYLLLNLAEGLRVPIVGPRGAVYLAWLLSSLFFGLMHMFNPHVTVLSIVNLCAAGLLLGLAYIRTGELGLPIGLHFSWNFFQGNVFGFSVSGLEVVHSTSVIVIQQGGPALWTGGEFGPEGGVLGLLVMGVGGLLVWLWTRERESSFM